jgi:hypothetical protein
MNGRRPVVTLRTHRYRRTRPFAAPPLALMAMR